jgi:hypothetical protein
MKNLKEAFYLFRKGWRYGSTVYGWRWHISVDSDLIFYPATDYSLTHRNALDMQRRWDLR